MKPSKDVAKLAERIEKEFGLKVDPYSFYRTRAGWHQRSAGAYTWVICIRNFVGFVGGSEPIRKYVTKRNRLEISERSLNEYELFVYAPNEPGYNKL